MPVPHDGELDVLLLDQQHRCGGKPAALTDTSYRHDSRPPCASLEPSRQCQQSSSLDGLHDTREHDQDNNLGRQLGYLKQMCIICLEVYSIKCKVQQK